AHRTFTGEKFTPYVRDEKTLARPWIVPGTPGFEHRIGGLEKKNIAGTVNYEPENHDYMVRIRGEKVKRIAQEWNPLSIDGPDSGDLLVIGWGGTYGAIRTAVDRSREKGLSVSRIHLRWINPFPQDLDAILKRFKHVLIPEINLGQLRMLIRAEYLVDAIGLNKVTGQPFSVREIENKITEILKK
ncbi:MAG TPA: 2-oxoglutarate ferredoxin oxidoreductase subunit alpha, partial [bacterium]|nr:2-oxoglutarate ferredoxin oxidoreductase subunit alpha [bacterium]